MDWRDLLSDPLWRICNLYQVQDEEGRVRPFRMREAQAYLYRRIWWRNAILKARQLGFSTFILLWMLDRMIFNGNLNAGLVDLKEDDAKKKLLKVSFAYETIGYGLDDIPADEKKAVNRFIHNLSPYESDSALHFDLANGSNLKASVSHRGGTLQLGHLSELGKIAHSFPTRAVEIKTGLFPACHGPLFSETTHMGGKFGISYEVLKGAMANEGLAADEWNRLHWRFNFFPWWMQKENRIFSRVLLSDAAVRHFEILERDHGIHLDEDQKKWWEMRFREMGSKMGTEYPSVPNDAFESPVEGAIYGNIITDLRTKGRIGVEFDIDRRFPCFVSWDIGRSDFTDLWLIQPAGPNIYFLNWYHANEQSPSHYAEIVREWEKHFPIAAHLLPHDAKRKNEIGVDYVHHLKTCGITNLEIVPVTNDRWAGIDALRELLRRSWFHRRCDLPTYLNGEELPSGVGRLASYRKKIVQVGEVTTEEPVHDEFSHTADAARTFAEATELGIVAKYSGPGGARVKRTTPSQAYLP